MEKSVLTTFLSLALGLAAVSAQAQVYRYNPQTGGSENLSRPTPTTTPTSPTAPRKPSAMKPMSPAEVNKMQKAVAAESKDERRTKDGASTNDLIGAVNKALAEEQKNAERKMLPLGRVGIVINPKDYNPTIERNIAELNKIADLDKLYMTPPAHFGEAFYLLKWEKLKGIEFIHDNRALVQKKFNITIPGFAYLRPDGTHTSYKLDDLAPFYEALTVQRRKVGK